jgi:hypothetical protein
MKSENIMVHFAKRVVLPELETMIKVVHDSLQYRIQELLNPNSLLAIKIQASNGDLDSEIEQCWESLVRIKMNDASSPSWKDFEPKLYSFILESYVRSQRVAFINGKYHLVEFEDEIGSEISDFHLGDGVYFKDVRHVDYGTPIKYKDDCWESSSDIKWESLDRDDFKFLLMDHKKIKEFWSKYPDGVMAFREFEPTYLMGKSILR